MKKIVAFLLILACLNLPVANYLRAGEVQKKPLKFDEMVELAKEQVQDYAETRDTEAGIANGYGLLTLALAIGVGYLVYDQVNNNDED
ncbi:MAG: hypothetical protein KDN19_19985 [Verrucomicrobiae bacterium]|nr:hypothetical protein [Verrucomicrobiae bacterium]